MLFGVAGLSSLAALALAPFASTWVRAILLPLPYTLFMMVIARAAHQRRLDLGHIVLIGFGLRCIAVWVLYVLYSHYNGVPFAMATAGDDYWYHDMATQLSRGGLDPSMDLGKSWAATGYVWWSATFYTLLSASTLVARFVNVALGCATIYLTYHLAKTIFHERVGRTAAAFTATFPMLVYYDAMQFKDSLIMFMVSLFLLSATKSQWPAILRIFGLFIPTSVLATLRPATGVVLLFLLPVYMVTHRSGLGKTTIMLSIVRGAFIIAALLAVTLPILEGTTGMSAVGALRLDIFDLRFNNRFYQLAVAGSGLGGWVEAKFLILAPAIAFLAPLLPPPTLLPQVPTAGGIAPTTVLAPAVFVWMLMAPLSYHGIYLMVRDWRQKAFLLYAFFMATAVGLTVQMVFMTDRHRVQLLTIAMIGAALSYDNWPKARVFKKVLPIGLALVVIGTIAFNWLRVSFGGL